MPGDTSKGNEDIFVARFEGNGARTWVRQFGAGLPANVTRNDAGYGIAVNGGGDVFVAGTSRGTFGTPNPNIDRPDYFMMKLKPADGTAY